jgi:hypothetical protein
MHFQNENNDDSAAVEMSKNIQEKWDNDQKQEQQESLTWRLEKEQTNYY